MSKKYHQKPRPQSPPPPARAGKAPADVTQRDRDTVGQAIEANHSDRAVDYARGVHRRCQSAASEALLLDAFDARIDHLLGNGLQREAGEMVEDLLRRFPSAHTRAAGWKIRLALRRGDARELLAPLADPATSPERQAAIAAEVRRRVCDPRMVAECDALPGDHPLRMAAAAVAASLTSVTSGPVADDALRLAEVPRSSPLAPWKMAVRAIAAFYRRDDELCRRCLEAIEPGSAAARLVPALRSMLQGKQCPSAAAAQLARAVQGRDSLRAALERLEQGYTSRRSVDVLAGVRTAIELCAETQPGLLDRLKQHISIRSVMAGFKVSDVQRAMGAPSRKNAYFWRLMACCTERHGNEQSIPAACAYWEEFRRHALHEKWFPHQGPEVAAIYLHMADLLSRCDTDYLSFAGIKRSFDGHAATYQDQPPEIRALMLRPPYDFYFFSEAEIYPRACAADPCSSNFQRWLNHALDSESGGDGIAEAWAAAIPSDVTPLLHLMQSAERRDALQKAFRYMERAEQADGLNPEVRRARLRLLVAIAIRHLRKKKAERSLRTLEEIRELPQSRQGDRPALVAILSCLIDVALGNRQRADAAFAEAVRLLGSQVTAHLLRLEVAQLCKQDYDDGEKLTHPDVPLCGAYGRVCAIALDVGLTPVSLDTYTPTMFQELARDVAVDPRSLWGLGQAAFAASQFPLAYSVARLGLLAGAEHQARFLYLRGATMPPWMEERHKACLAAAKELARRQHDAELLRKIGEHRQAVFLLLDSAEAAAPSNEEIARIVARESKDRTIPDPPDEEDEPCDCPACRAMGGAPPPGLEDIFEELGPDAFRGAVEQLFETLGGIGHGKRGRKRRPRSHEDDFPF
jgi:hypothetical protein